MSAVAALLLAVAIEGLLIGYVVVAYIRQDTRITTLEGRHARPQAPVRPANGRTIGDDMPHLTRPRRADTQPVPVVSTSLLAPVRHADAMRRAAEPYMPPPPVCVDRPVTRTETADHPPWTGSQPALTEDDLIEMDRQAWARAELEALGDHPTEAAVGHVYAGLWALPRPSAPVYGEQPVADVLEAERLSGLMQP